MSSGLYLCSGPSALDQCTNRNRPTPVCTGPHPKAWPRFMIDDNDMHLTLRYLQYNVLLLVDYYLSLS